jgi:hypothetical protein
VSEHFRITAANGDVLDANADEAGKCTAMEFSNGRADGLSLAALHEVIVQHENDF